MQSLDSSIANVSLPYMQGSCPRRRRDHLGADLLCDRRRDHDRAGRLDGGAVRTQEPAHRLHGGVRGRLDAVRRGRTLEQMVVFRLLQGMCGAALVPLSQATMLDIYPFERRAQAMAIFGMGVMVGPITGPDARRLSDRDVQLALRVLRQPAVRRAGDRPGCWSSCRRRAPRAS